MRCWMTRQLILLGGGQAVGRWARHHLTRCPRCRSYAAAAQAVESHLLHTPLGEEASPQVVASVMAQVRGMQTRPRVQPTLIDQIREVLRQRWAPAALVTAAVVIVAAATLWIAQQPSSPGQEVAVESAAVFPSASTPVLWDQLAQATPVGMMESSLAQEYQQELDNVRHDLRALPFQFWLEPPSP